MEEQVLTIDVLPQTVADVIYLNSPQKSFEQDEDDESNISSTGSNNEDEIYEIGCVSPTQLHDLPLVYDESESFVMLPDYIKVEINEMNEQEIDSEIVISNETSETNNYMCSVCNLSFPYKKLLHEHRVLHKENSEIIPSMKEIFTCILCDKTFRNGQALSVHFRRFHPDAAQMNSKKQSYQPEINNSNSELQAFNCNICGCPLVNEIALLYHYKKHEPMNYSCDKCNAEYNNETDFNNHKKIHQVKYLYACNKCGESFPTTCLVSRHIRMVHTRNN